MSLKNAQKYILCGNIRKKRVFVLRTFQVLCGYFAGFIVSIIVVTTVFYKRMQA